MMVMIQWLMVLVGKSEKVTEGIGVASSMGRVQAQTEGRTEVRVAITTSLETAGGDPADEIMMTTKMTGDETNSLPSRLLPIRNSLTRQRTSLRMTTVLMAN